MFSNGSTILNSCNKNVLNTNSNSSSNTKKFTLSFQNLYLFSGLDCCRLRRRRQEVGGEEDLPALQLGVEWRRGPGLKFNHTSLFLKHLKAWPVFPQPSLSRDSLNGLFQCLVGGTPRLKIGLNFIEMLAAPLPPFHGTPVGNHWTKPVKIFTVVIIATVELSYNEYTYNIHSVIKNPCYNPQVRPIPSCSLPIIIKIKIYFI